MYRTGHLGVALLVFAPIGYLLVAADAPLAALVTAGVMLQLSMLPDVDNRLPVGSHRGVTHSLLFAAVVGAGFAVAGTALVAVGSGPLVAELLGLDALSIGVVPFAFAVGFLAVGSHLLGDLLTPAGVTLFWPAPTEFSLYVTRADSMVANYGLFLLGVLAVGAANTLAFGIV